MLLSAPSLCIGFMVNKALFSLWRIMVASFLASDWDLCLDKHHYSSFFQSFSRSSQWAPQITKTVTQKPLLFLSDRVKWMIQNSGCLSSYVMQIPFHYFAFKINKCRIYSHERDEWSFVQYDNFEFLFCVSLSSSGYHIATFSLLCNYTAQLHWYKVSIFKAFQRKTVNLCFTLLHLTA